MKSFFRSLLPRKSSPPAFRTSDAPSALHADSQAVNRQQLVLITLRDLLRRSGVPSGWVECQTLLVTSRSRGNGLYIHLVVRHWDERLNRFALAFQTELKERVVRFDAKAAQWIHGIAWDFDDAKGCPWPVMPHKSLWLEPAPAAPSRSGATSAVSPPAHFPAVVPSARNSDDIARDLDALFAIRDKQIGAKDVHGNTAPAFETTEPAPLQR